MLSRANERTTPAASCSSVGPRIEDGDIVGIDPPPGAETVEQAQRGRARLQQQAVDVVVLQQREKLADILELKRVVVRHGELFAVQLGPAVDVDGHLSPDQVTAEGAV